MLHFGHRSGVAVPGLRDGRFQRGEVMGAHKYRPNPDRRPKTKLTKSPERPNNIGKRRRITTIWGAKLHMVIEDEILHKQYNAPHKLVAFQRIRLEEENRIEYRFGYYMIGVKPGAKGRWVWGQFCLLIPERDLKAIMKKAEKRGWFQQAEPTLPRKARGIRHCTFENNGKPEAVAPDERRIPDS
jgi:hypothetical protein